MFHQGIIYQGGTSCVGNKKTQKTKNEKNEKKQQQKKPKKKPTQISIVVIICVKSILYDIPSSLTKDSFPS